MIGLNLHRIPIPGPNHDLSLKALQRQTGWHLGLYDGIRLLDQAAALNAPITIPVSMFPLCPQVLA